MCLPDLIPIKKLALTIMKMVCVKVLRYFYRAGKKRAYMVINLFLSRYTHIPQQTKTIIANMNR